MPPRLCKDEVQSGNLNEANKLPSSDMEGTKP